MKCRIAVIAFQASSIRQMSLSSPGTSPARASFRGSPAAPLLPNIPGNLLMFFSNPNKVDGFNVFLGANAVNVQIGLSKTPHAKNPSYAHFSHTPTSNRVCSPGVPSINYAGWVHTRPRPVLIPGNSITNLTKLTLFRIRFMERTRKLCFCCSILVVFWSNVGSDWIGPGAISHSKTRCWHFVQQKCPFWLAIGIPCGVPYASDTLVRLLDLENRYWSLAVSCLKLQRQSEL